MAAGTRHRVLQWFPALQAAGYRSEYSPFFEAPAVGPSGPAAVRAGLKATRLARGLWTRAKLLVSAGRFSAIVVQRELAPNAWNDLAPLVARRTPLIFDFDDAVFLPRGLGSLNAIISRPSSTARLIAASSLVWAGNEYLATYARRHHDRVEVLPTVVDTEVFRPRPRPPRDVPVIGWIGSPQTAKYLEAVLPVLEELARSFHFRVRLIGAGDIPRPAGLEVEMTPWRLDTEADDFADLDLGLYPLSDDPWARGKCGFKAIQYMACGVPQVVSPVGVCRDIVRDGQDGLWADTPARWKDALAHLLADAPARAAMAASGPPRIRERWSLAAWAPRVVAGVSSVAAPRLADHVRV
jgi:glycosyltransferase involved in cell wall biosynthesis